MGTITCLCILPKFVDVTNEQGGGPRVVVSTAAIHARIRGSVPGLGGFKETTCENQYCGEPP